MRSKIMTCLRMRSKRLLFFIVNFILCGIARAAINTLSLRRLAIYFGKFERTLTMSTLVSQHQRQKASFIGQSVRLAAKYTPWDSNCLTQAIVAKCWCRLYRIPYIFYIGLKPSADEVSGYAAHAWITAGPVAITGGQGLLDYYVISSYVSRAKDGINYV